MQGEEQGNHIEAVIRVQMAQQDGPDVIDAAGQQPGLDQTHQGAGAGIEHDSDPVDVHQVGRRRVAGCGYGATGAQDVNAYHGYKATDPVGNVKVAGV